jgi:DNA primase
MLEAAQLVRTFLDELGLQSFLKTSGGKSLHVVVPLTSRDNCRIEFPIVHMRAGSFSLPAYCRVSGSSGH